MIRKYLNLFLNWSVPLGLILFALLLALRLLHIITWSWWWVFSPASIPAAVIIAATIWVYIKLDK